MGTELKRPYCAPIEDGLYELWPKGLRMIRFVYTVSFTENVCCATIKIKEAIVMTVMVRVEESIRDRIKKIAREEGRKMNEIIAEAIDHYERERFLNSFNKAYSKIRRNPKEWESLQEELKIWDSILNDGLEGET